MIVNENIAVGHGLKKIGGFLMLGVRVIWNSGKLATGYGKKDF